MAGLSDQGFTPKSVDEIRNDIKDKLKLAFGDGIDTSATSRVGQMVDIFSNELSSVWEGLQADYYSRYPSTATGVGLDHVVEITNTRRRAGFAAQGKIFLAGAKDTVVGAGTRISKTNTDFQFFTLNAATIVDFCNILICSSIPNAGTISVNYQDEPIEAINFDDDEATIKAKIEAHSAINEVEVKGTLNTVGSFKVKLINTTLVDTELKIDDETLTRFGVATDNNTYFSSEYEVDVLSVDNQAITVPQVSLTNIVTTVSGFDACINYETGVTGSASETDAQLRARRTEELQKRGTTTLGGIKQNISEVPLVSSVTIVQNDTTEEVDARPPHSYECFVIGGDDNEVAQAIYDAKPPGIAVVSTAELNEQRQGTVTDVNGSQAIIEFSKPLEVPVMIVVNITKNDTYEPTAAEPLIKQNIFNYFDTLSLGDDVLTYKLIAAVAPVTGIVDVEILTDTVDGNTPIPDNVVIATQEVATLSEANINITAV